MAEPPIGRLAQGAQFVLGQDARDEGHHHPHRGLGVVEPGEPANLVGRNPRPFGGDIDRKSVVKGKSVSVRGDLGGRRIIKKKNTKIETYREDKMTKKNKDATQS